MSEINIESLNLNKVLMKQLSDLAEITRLSLQKWVRARRTPAKEVKLEKAIQSLEEYWEQLNIDEMSLDQLYSLKRIHHQIETYYASDDATHDLALLWDHYERNALALRSFVGRLVYRKHLSNK